MTHSHFILVLVLAALLAPLAEGVAMSEDSPAIYYVATNDPSASNEDCDGLAPVDEGAGRCPFKDLNSERTRYLLRDVGSVRVELRAGTYTVIGEAIHILGTGSSPDEAVVLTSYQGEVAVLDGGGAVNELVRLEGGYGIVSGLTFQAPAQHHIRIDPGSHHSVVSGNRFLQNGTDGLKGLPGAGSALIAGNEFTQWSSQAIDMTGVSGWTIVANRLHDPAAAGGGGNGIGMKYGSHNVVIAGNEIYNLPAASGAISLGGTSSPHENEFEAAAIIVAGNDIHDVAGPSAQFVSCRGCTFAANRVVRAGAGVIVSNQATGASGCPGGCRPSEDALIVGNAFVQMIGGDLLEAPPNVFVGLFPSESHGLVASGNLYCLLEPGEAVFVHAPDFIPFQDWQARTGTDRDSRVAVRNDPGCASP